MAPNGVAFEHIFFPDDDAPDDDVPNDDVEMNAILLDSIGCERCHTLLATRIQFIQDLLPQAYYPRHPSLFHTAVNVDYGKVEHRVNTLMSEIENAMVSSLYCERCQKFAGWRIEETYQGDVQVQQFGENPVFRPGQCILLYRSHGRLVV